MRRHKHSLSHYRLLTCDMGELIPVGCLEVLPGDTFQHRTSALIRFSPQLAPVMHPIQIRVHHWFVPNRLLWSGWEDFITGGRDGTGSTDKYPTVVGAPVVGGLMNYMGLPVTTVEQTVCAFPFRAYNLIFNEWYRDQDLVNPIDDLDDLTIKRIAWEKDYFSSARPWTQKGPDVTVPLGAFAPVIGIGGRSDGPNWPAQDVLETARGAVEYASSWATDGESRVFVEEDPNNPGVPGVYADLSTATSASINDFRRAFALQRYQEARARYGSRYTEYLAYLGIRASDQRLQRPEYLGGGRSTVAFSEVLQTADLSAGGGGAVHQNLGDLGGHGISAMRTRRYRRFFEEHGFVLSLMSVRPKVMYTDGQHRKWARRTKEDYYQKELEAIGQQAVTNREVYAESDDGNTFGYADRYREYREEPSGVAGDFETTLDYWHLARKFESPPALNQSFVECEPSKRIFAEQTTDALWCMVRHSVQARRMVNRTAHAVIM